MSIPKAAAIIAAVALFGLVASAIAHAGPVGDLIFSIAAICFVIAALMFFGWTLITLGKEFRGAK